MDSEQEVHRKHEIYFRKVYNEDWEKLPIFKGWLINGEKGIYFGKCKVCDRHLRAQRSDIYKHSQSLIHQKNMEKKGLKPVMTPYPFKKKVNKNVYMNPESIDKNISEDSEGYTSSYRIETAQAYDPDSYDTEANDIIEYEHEEHILEDEPGDFYEEVNMEDLQEYEFKINLEPEPEPEQEQPTTTTTPAGSKVPQIYSEGECEIFGVFITNEMKGLDPRKRKLFKKKILQILIDMEDE